MAQRSGVLPADNPISWRGNSGLNHWGDKGEDLSGGWYHAGDHLGKLIYPNAAATTWLLWSLIDYKEAYVGSGLYAEMLETVKWSLDHLVKCHTAENELYFQCYNFEMDTMWNRWEDINWNQTCIKLTPEHSDSAIVAEVAAAFAAGSIVWREIDLDFANDLLTRSKQLFHFASTYRHMIYEWLVPKIWYYIPTYHEDELVWAKTWIAMATGQSSDLEAAEALYDSFANITARFALNFWDEKHFPLHILLGRMTQKDKYLDYLNNRIQEWLEYPKTPKGLVYKGPQLGLEDLKHTANMSYMLLVVYDSFSNTQIPTKPIIFQKAKNQIDYLLGESGRSFVTGFGVNPPVRPRHMAASCPDLSQVCDEFSFVNPDINPHQLEGALIFGLAGWDFIYDDRTDGMQVSTEGNMGLHCSVARLSCAGPASLNNRAQSSADNNSNLVEGSDDLMTTLSNTDLETSNQSSICVDKFIGCEQEKQNWNMCNNSWWRTTQCQRTCCECGIEAKTPCVDYKSEEQCEWARTHGQCGKTNLWGYWCQKTCRNCDLDSCEIKYPGIAPPAAITCKANPSDPLSTSRPKNGTPLCPDLRSDCQSEFRIWDICHDPQWLNDCLTTCCVFDCTAGVACEDFSSICSEPLLSGDCKDPLYNYICQKTCGSCSRNNCASC